MVAYYISLEFLPLIEFLTGSIRVSSWSTLYPLTCLAFLSSSHNLALHSLASSCRYQPCLFSQQCSFHILMASKWQNIKLFVSHGLVPVHILEFPPSYLPGNSCSWFKTLVQIVCTIYVCAPVRVLFSFWFHVVGSGFVIYLQAP